LLIFALKVLQMINSVRNTVLSVLNKNNYGYISPSDFNLFAKQAQLDIFEDYFYQYNYQINKENARQSGTGYADITKGYSEVIDSFSVTAYLAHIATNTFSVPTELTTDSDYYLINKVLFVDGTSLKEMEQVSHSKITMLLNSLYTAPSTTFPAFTIEESTLTAYPDTIDEYEDVKCQYIRYPEDPKWTYLSLTGGEPAFDSTASDYQDFELPLDDEPDLIMKILQYAGMSIREIAAVQFAQGAENKDDADQK
jgi:hypothetical protein